MVAFIAPKSGFLVQKVGHGGVLARVIRPLKMSVGTEPRSFLKPLVVKAWIYEVVVGGIWEPPGMGCLRPRAEKFPEIFCKNSQRSKHPRKNF